MTGLVKRLFYAVADPVTGDSDVGRLRRAVAKERELAEIDRLRKELDALRANRNLRGEE